MPVRNYCLELNEGLECYDLVSNGVIGDGEPIRKELIAHVYDGCLAIRIRDLLQQSKENNLD